MASVSGKPIVSRKPTVGGKPTVVGFTIRNRGLPELGHPSGWASETTRGKSGIGRQPAERVALPVKGSLGIAMCMSLGGLLPHSAKIVSQAGKSTIPGHF